MDITARFRTVVRRIVGLSDDPGAPPRIDRLAFYRAEVKAASDDGKTLDVSPEDPRIPPHQKVPMHVGIPGAVVVVKAGSVVWLGWERGDPQRPRCVPTWESGATVAKVVFVADKIYQGAESGAQPVAVADDLEKRLSTLEDKLNNFTFDFSTDASGVVTSNAVVGSPCTVTAGTLKHTSKLISDPPSIKSTVAFVKK